MYNVADQSSIPYQIVYSVTYVSDAFIATRIIYIGWMFIWFMVMSDILYYSYNSYLFSIKPLYHCIATYNYYYSWLCIHMPQLAAITAHVLLVLTFLCNLSVCHS